MIDWAHSGAVVAAAFLASLVEFVEALTIVLAVGTVRGWRPALVGAGAGVLLLVLLLAILGPLLSQLPFAWLQLVVGVLLLLFGMRWLRKAVLRSAGTMLVACEAELTHDSGIRQITAIGASALTWPSAHALGMEVQP